MTVAGAKFARAAQLGAIAILLLAGARAARTWQHYAAATASLGGTLVDGLAKPGISLETLGGIGLDGEPVAPALSERSRVVLFLLRSGSAAKDLKFWNKAAEIMSGAPWLQFRGYCEGTACNEAARSLNEFLVYRAGGIRTLEAVLQADAQGEALVVTAANKQVVRAIPWRRQESPAQADREIVGAR